MMATVIIVISFLIVVPIQSQLMKGNICPDQNQFFDVTQSRCRHCSEICDTGSYGNDVEQCIKPCQKEPCHFTCESTTTTWYNKMTCKLFCTDILSGHSFCVVKFLAMAGVLLLVTSFVLLGVKLYRRHCKRNGNGYSHLQEECESKTSNINTGKDDIITINETDMSFHKTGLSVNDFIKKTQSAVQNELVVIESNNDIWIGTREDADEIVKLRRDFPLIPDLKDKFAIISKLPWVKRMVSNGRYTRIIYDGDKTRDVEKEIFDLVGLESKLFEFIYEE